MREPQPNGKQFFVHGAKPRRLEIWPVPPAPLMADDKIDERALDQLVDFYIQAGVDGLFILAYSGEALELSEPQRLEICRRVVARAAGRIRIVAGGNTGGDLPRQVSQLQEMADTGVEAVVVFASTLPAAAGLKDDLLQVAEQISTPLGVYECPVPQHRLLSADDVLALAESGRYVFMKETSRDRAQYRAKLDAAQGSPLKVMPANFGQLPTAIEDGCLGFCGIIASAFPELTDAYCNDSALEPATRKLLFDALGEFLSCMTRRHYPASLKYVLSRRGVPISTRSLMNCGVDVDAEDRLRLDEALEQLELLTPPRLWMDRPSSASPAFNDAIAIKPRIKTDLVSDA